MNEVLKQLRSELLRCQAILYSHVLFPGHPMKEKLQATLEEIENDIKEIDAAMATGGLVNA